MSYTRSTIRRQALLRVESLEDRTLLEANPLLDQFTVAETFSLEASSPSTAVINQDGTFVTVWESFEDVGDSQGFGLYLNVYDAEGTPLLTEPLTVNQTLPGDQLAPEVASNGNGNFLVVWQSKVPEGDQEVYGRWFTLTDQLTPSDEFLLIGGEGDQMAPAVAMSASGEAILTWQTNENGTFDVMGAELAPLAETPTNVIPIANSVEVDETSPTVAYSSDGSHYVYAWIAPGSVAVEEEADLDVFARRSTPSGLGDAETVNATLTRDQVDPQIAITNSGDVLVAWVSEGIPGSGSDIFSRRYDATTGEWQSEQVVNTQTEANQSSPAIAMDANGNAVIAWQSVHEDGYSWGIYATAYDETGTATRSDFLVNERVQGPQIMPAVAIHPTSGETVITWLGRDDRHQPSIQARRYSIPITEATTDPAEFYLANYREMDENPPSGVMDALGNSFIVWQSFDEDGSGFGVFGQILDYYGEPIGERILVNEGMTLGNQSAPDVALRPGALLTGSSDEVVCVIVYQSDNSVTGNHEIYAQLYGVNGTALGAPLLVSDAATSGRTPSVAMDAQGNFIVAYELEEADADLSEIYGRYYDADVGDWRDEPFQMNYYPELTQTTPQVAMNSQGDFVAVWVTDHPAAAIPEDEEGEGEDSEKSIAIRWYKADGNDYGPEEIASVFVAEAQEHPSVAMDDAGNVVVAWQSINQEWGGEPGHGTGQPGVSWGVYARQFTPDRVPLNGEPEFLVNETITGPQRSPNVGMDSEGNFVITWESNSHDFAGKSWEVYVRQYNSDGTPSTGEELVNSWGTGPQINPIVVENSLGDFGIFWMGQGEAHLDGVHGRLYYHDLPEAPSEPCRFPIGDQFLVSETFALEGSAPSVAMLNDANQFVVAYGSFEEVEEGSGYDVYFAIHDSEGVLLTVPALVNEVNVTGDQIAPVVASDGHNNFFIVWQSADEVGSRVYGRWYAFDPATNNFSALTDELLLDELAVSGEQYAPTVAMSGVAESSALVAWSGNAMGDLDVYVMEVLHPDATEGTDLIPGISEVPTVINETTEGDQTAAAVAMTLDGSRYVIAWQGPGIVTAEEPEPLAEEEEEEVPTIDVFFRYYGGTGLGSEIVANFELAHDQVEPAVAMDALGNFAIAFTSEGQVSSGSDIYVSRFDSDGNPIAQDELVNPDPLTRPQRAPTIAMDAVGNVLVGWQAVHADEFSWGIYAREYDPAGVGTWRDTFPVNEYVMGPQTTPVLATSPDGFTVIAWNGQDPTHSWAVHAQTFQMLSGEADQRLTEEDLILNAYFEPEGAPPAAAMDARGRSIVTWESYAEDGSGLGIFAQLLDDRGNPIGERISVNTVTEGNQRSPAVAMSEDGYFVITFESEVTEGDVTTVKLFARRFAPDGTPLDPVEIPVTMTSFGEQRAPAVVMGEDHSFVIAWQGYQTETSEDTDIFARRFNPSGTADGAAFIVNQHQGLDQFGPALAMNDSGDLVITWVSDHPALVPELEDTEKSIFAQFFPKTGQMPTEPEVLVHKYVKDAQEHPRVAMDPAGNFVVVWQSINQDGGTWGVFARQFNRDLVPYLPREIVVNVTRTGLQRYPSVGMSEDGRFVVTWQSMNRGEVVSSWDVYQRQYTPDGRPAGGEYLVNESWTSGPQTNPVVAQSPGAKFGIFWLGSGEEHVEGVYGRLYSTPRSTLANKIMAVGTGPGSPATVHVYDAETGELLRSMQPFGDWSGGVNVAVGDVDGDGYADVIVAAASNAMSTVAIFSGQTGEFMGSFYGFTPLYTGGVNVAAADVNGDGQADIILGAATGLAHVRIVDGTMIDQTIPETAEIAPWAQLGNFYAFTPLYAGGVTVAAADFNCDGRADVITGAASGLAHVRVIDAAQLDQRMPTTAEIAPWALLANFYAFTPAYLGGVNVAAGDFNGDGSMDIITGARIGMAHVRVIDATGMHLLTPQAEIAPSALLANFYAFDPFAPGGVSVCSLHGVDSYDDLVVGTGEGSSLLHVLDSDDLAELMSFNPFESSFTDGIVVAAC